MGKNNVELLKMAQKHLGQGGAVFNRYCNSSGAWCCAFVTYIFHEGDDSSLFYGGKKVVYCPTAIKWASANLAMIPAYLALPMDIVFFDWNHNGLPDHIGFIRERKSCDEVYTIEGNTNGGVVAQKTRPVKYIQGIYRPHFPARFDASKPLVIDGLFGYNSIAVVQTALKKLGYYNGAIDAIMGKGTVKAIQKWAGVAQDGAWGTKTSKAVQRKLGVTADGLFGKESCKALQRWANAQVFPQQTWVDKANAWARMTANCNDFHYMRWASSDKATHTCPICTKRAILDYIYDAVKKVCKLVGIQIKSKPKYVGWNCIGFAYAVWHHGGQLGTTCNCGVISNGTAEKLLKVSQAEANKLATSKIGKSVTVIRNGGKAIPIATLKAGDICMLYKGSTYYHTIYYMGNGKFAESNTTGGVGSAKNIRADLTLSSTAKSKLKLAIRYTGK